MIFLAVAAPTPGSPSSSCWEALFRSTLVVFFEAASAAPLERARTARHPAAKRRRFERVLITDLPARRRPVRSRAASPSRRLCGAAPEPMHEAAQAHVERVVAAEKRKR